MNNNKAVIFDGDGTLWRPTGHDNKTRPDSIYKGMGVEKDSHLSLSLVEGVVDLLNEIKSLGYYIFIVSAHPTPGTEALRELESKINTLGITSAVSGYFCSDGNDRSGKAGIIIKLLTDHNLDADKTFMVGDSYYYDYEAGVTAGVNSFFIKNDYCKQPSPLPSDVKTVNNVTELINYIKD